MEEVQVQIPEVHQDVSDGIKAQIKECTNFGEGFNAWQESFADEVEHQGFQQAWVDHWRGLKTLHKLHVKPKTGQKKKQMKKTICNAIAQAAKVHTLTFEGVESMGSQIRTAVMASDATAAAPKLAAAPVSGDSAVASLAASNIDKESLKAIVEADKTPVPYEINLPFYNWGLTVRNTPAITFMPTSKTGVKNIIKWAGKNNKKVRASGYRHTWTDMYTSNDQVLVSMLPLNQATRIPQLRPIPITPNEEDLEHIEIVGTIEENGVKKGLCKIGASTTNDQFRMWCLDKSKNGGQWKWTIPLNVIMVEITWGGSNGPICHGAGWKQQTLSDLVTEVEFVNFNGELQVVNDPEQLRAAAGAFGLMGIVTAITVKLDPMTYAAMRPSKTPTVLAVPPPEGVKVPKDLKPKKYKPEQIAAAVKEFERACEEDYYAEWFWFPYRDDCWVNCWKNDGNEKDAKTIPQWKVLSQGIEGMLGNAFNVTLGKLSPSLQTWVLAWSAMAVLPDIKPDEPPATVPLIEALHFRRGIQNMRVIDMELEIPIPPRADDPSKPDWSICQKAWWAVITRAYEYRDRKQYPLRVALEMRVMGGSNIWMAPQYGNSFGTCSIEILTTPQTDPVLWRTFMQEISDVWMSYTGPDGKPLNTRSHWAKQWQELTINNIPAQEYYRTVSYKKNIHQFRKQLRAVAAAGGYSLDDMKTRFANPLLEYLFFSKESENVASSPIKIEQASSSKERSTKDKAGKSKEEKTAASAKEKIPDKEKHKEKDKEKEKEKHKDKHHEKEKSSSSKSSSKDKKNK